MYNDAGGDGMRLLLVEDEKRMAQALCEILRLEKYDVDHYSDGMDAMCAVESGAYDLIVLDVMLPHKNGFLLQRKPAKKALRHQFLC